MDELSRRSQALGGSAAGAPPPAVDGLAHAVQQEGGIDTLLGKMRAGGLDHQVDSWVSTGPNEPVDPNQLGAALGPDTVERLSARSGIDIGSLLPLLAMFLPQIIDMLTPDGTTPPGGLDSATGQGGMPDLGGLLGGLLGGAGGAGGVGGVGGGGGQAGSGGLDDLLRGLGGDKGR